MVLLSLLEIAIISRGHVCFMRKARNFYGEKPFLNKASAHDIATPSSLIHLHPTNVSFIYLFSLFPPMFSSFEEAVMAMFQLISIFVFCYSFPNFNDGFAQHRHIDRKTCCYCVAFLRMQDVSDTCRVKILSNAAVSSSARKVRSFTGNKNLVVNS